ncbi:MAG TPA: hypothetical protein VIS05_03815, partial [Ilumatobacter sp.]
APTSCGLLANLATTCSDSAIEGFTDGAADTTPSTWPTGGTNVVTYTWNDSEELLPTNPFTRIGFAAGAIEDKVGGHTNPTAVYQVVTLP